MSQSERSSEKSLLDETLETLKTLRDEARVQAHLGKEDLGDEWDRLESRWHDVQRRSREMAHDAGEAVEGAMSGLGLAIEELRRGYEKLRDRV